MFLEIIFDRQVLAAHHPVTLEPFAAELLGCEVSAVKEWGRRAPEGTWAKARDALLAQLGGVGI